MSRKVHFPAHSRGEPGLVTRVLADDAGWDLLNLEVRRLPTERSWAFSTGEAEAVLVMLGGRASVSSTRGDWEIGRRPDVFSGMPWALYLPRRTTFQVLAQNEVELACCWVPTDEDLPAALVRPEDVQVEIRGGSGATRQINTLVPAGFDCHRLVACEVFTPGGNQSSYPPHKHDTHNVAPDGSIVEADLEEFYYYKIDKPQGFAFQRVYTADGSLDEAVVCRTDDVVLVPEGYHPVAAVYGYDCYYLNFLAGSAQSFAATDDPDHAWTKHTWTGRDPRVPLVHLGMEPR